MTTYPAADIAREPRLLEELKAALDTGLASGDLVAPSQITQLLDLFRQRFGPAVLRGLDGEALLLRMHGRQDSEARCLPRSCSRVGLHIDLFGACSAFTRVAARTLAPSPICDQLHRRLQPFRHLHDCSGCFRLERSPGGALTHWKAPPSHGARKERSFVARARTPHIDAILRLGRAGRRQLLRGRGLAAVKRT